MLRARGSYRRSWCSFALLLAVLLAAPAAGQGADSAIARVEVSGASVMLHPQVEFDWARVTVAKRGDAQVWQQEFAHAAVMTIDLRELLGEAFGDGRYDYELRLMKAASRPPALDASLDEEGRAETMVQALSGRLEVEGGSVADLDGWRPAEVAPTGELAPRVDLFVDGNLRVSGYGCLGCPSNQILIPGKLRVVHATLPGLELHAATSNILWTVVNSAGDLGFRRAGTTIVGIANGSPANSLLIDGQGRVGLGTGTPQRRLHLVNSAPSPQSQLMLENSAGDIFTVGTASTPAGALVMWGPDGSPRVTIQPNTFVNAIHAASTGVGIGTTNPLTRLFVTGSDPGPSQTQIQVRSTSATTASRQMLGYVNNGPPSMAFTDTSINQTWLISSLANGQFVIKPSGPVNAMRIAPNGNVFIAGTLTQGSSREIKDQIQLVDSREILARLEELPVATWHYKGAAEDGRHLGPMAEDFQRVFGLGASDKHLAPSDVAGVALAAVQALRAENQELILANQELVSRLAALEEIVRSQLAASATGEAGQ